MSGLSESELDALERKLFETTELLPKGEAAVLRAMMMSLMAARRITRKLFALTVDQFAAEGGVVNAMKNPKAIVQLAQYLSLVEVGLDEFTQIHQEDLKC